MWLIWSAKKESSKVFFDFLAELKRKAKEKTLAFLLIRKLSFCSFLSRVKNTSNRQTRKELLLLSKNCLAGVASFKKCLHFEKEQFLHLRKSTHNRAVEKSSRTHTDRFCFFEASGWNRESSRKRAVFSLEKEQFFSLEKEHTKEKSKSLLVHTRQTDFDRREVASLSKKCLHSCRFYKYKTIAFSSALCARAADALPFALSALSLSLHFEEAFVVVVSEEARFCLRSLFLVV